MKRREFITLLIQTTGAVASVQLLSSCGGGGGSDSSGGGSTGANCTATNVSCTIDKSLTNSADNHGHVLTIPQADVSARTDKTYTLSTGAGHTHTITITTAQFDKITSKAGFSAVASSTDSSHFHSVSVVC